MKTVNIVQPFTLTRQDGSRTNYPPGPHEFEDEYATFWYVLAHSDNPPAPNPPPGTREYAELEMKKAARRQILDAAAAELAEEAAVKEQAEHVETVRRRVIDNVTKPTTKEIKL